MLLGWHMLAPDIEWPLKRIAGVMITGTGAEKARIS
jgi:hypothetical protein